MLPRAPRLDVNPEGNLERMNVLHRFPHDGGDRLELFPRDLENELVVHLQE